MKRGHVPKYISIENTLDRLCMSVVPNCADNAFPVIDVDNKQTRLTREGCQVITTCKHVINCIRSRISRIQDFTSEIIGLFIRTILNCIKVNKK